MSTSPDIAGRLLPSPTATAPPRRRGLPTAATWLQTSALERARLRTVSLSQNVAWSLAGNVIYGACQWGIVVVLAQLGSPEMVGQFTLGLALTAPVLMLANLQLRVIQATDAKDRYDFGHYFALRIVTTSAALLTVFGMAWAAGYRSETLAVILLLALIKAVESFCDVVYGLLQKHERMQPLAQSLVLRGVLSLVALSVVVWLTESLAWGMAAMLLVWTASLVCHDFPVAARLLKLRQHGLLAKEVAWLSRAEWKSAAILGSGEPSYDDGKTLGSGEPSYENAETLGSGEPSYDDAGAWRPCWSWHALRCLAWQGLPLGFVMMLISLNSNIPRYFIELHLGPAQLGVFAAMAYFVVAGGLVMASVGQAASPRLARYYAQRNAEAFRLLVCKLLLAALTLGIPAIAVSWLAGSELLRLLYGPVYAEQVHVFVWLMVALCFTMLGTVLGYAITATRLFHSFTPYYAAITVIGGVASATLIPSYGLLGAAWTTCTIAVASCVMPLFILKNAWRRV